jgi:cation diffusion facilitator CzcD-associated flavoprotein CzcO
MLHKLRSYGFNARIFEKAPHIGGTWYWNKYPGARCDTESLQYSYQFSEELQQEWEWSEKYATQPEILKYLKHVEKKFKLSESITLNRTITDIIYDGKAGLYKIRSNHSEEYYSKFCILASGCLSVPIKPNIMGVENFTGEIFQTSKWPDKNIDFNNKNVAIIGTGSSGVHVIPIIAEYCKKLFVLQRTPNYAVPAHNRKLSDEYVKKFKDNYKVNREKAKKLVSGFLTHYNSASALEVNDSELKREYDKRWEAGGLAFLAAFCDITYNKSANKTATDYIESKIKEIVEDQKIAKLLTPNSIVGCKRLVIDSNYYATYNRKNVALIDINQEPIKTLTEKTLKLKNIELDIDTLILSTGFDAMTGAINNINIVGENSKTLKDKWSSGPSSYLGLMVNGFPNLFTITGPGSPSVLTNMIPTIEQHVDWIAECIRYMKKRSYYSIEANLEAERSWVKFNEDSARNTLRYECKSWYLGSNVKDKQRIFLPFVGGLPAYIKKCEEIVKNSYEGFRFSN